MISIWLDDIRTPHPSYTHWVKSWDELKPILDECLETLTPIDLMSFDHDLGLNSPDGYEIIKKIGVEYGGVYPLKINVHSANPVGAENIEKYDKWYRSVILQLGTVK